MQTMRLSIREASQFLALALVACGGVAQSDPSLWEPSKDPGGTQVDFTPGAPQGGGVSSFGGAPPGSGGQQVFGGGGQVAFGSGGFQNQGAGGYFPGAGGAPFGSGGMQQNPGSGGMQQVGAGGTPAGNSGDCTFKFTVTTVTARGNYAPNNVGALWIEDSSGKFVRALEVWGFVRLSNLTAFSAVGGNSVDAVTSATLPNHRQHADTWNCQDTNKQAVVNGSYQACVSFAEDDAFPFFGPPTHVACVPFNKGSGPFSSNPPDVANFTGWSLVMQ